MEGLYEAAFEALLRGSDDLILILDRECRILDAGGQARAFLAEIGRPPGVSFLEGLSVNSRRALPDFLDALGTDGAITLEHEAAEGGVGEIRLVRYAAHAIPKPGLHRDFLLVGREVHGRVPADARLDTDATDPLTGLANRRGLASGLARLGAAGEPHPGRRLAWILMVDVDHFKAINDRHGHAAGDDTLTAIAGVLVKSVREGDVVARYGGDEFVVAGPATEPGDAARIADRILAAVRALDPLPDGANPPTRVTVSIGGGVFRPDAEVEFRQALDTADRLMYRAKAEGRDRATIATDLL